MVGTPSGAPSRDPLLCPPYAKRKDRRRSTGLLTHINLNRSKLLVCSARGLVCRILDGVLGIAQRLLTLALDFLERAFALQPVGTGGLADTLLGLAHGFVGRAFNLVCRATHWNSPWWVIDFGGISPGRVKCSSAVWPVSPVFCSFRRAR